MVYVWLAMYIATFFQIAGMVGAIADVFRFGGVNLRTEAVAAGVALSCAVLLAVGRYRVIERASTTMVALFTLFTLLAVGALAWTEYPITFAAIQQGFTFELPDDLTIALAAFGIIGVGASELIYYPYWCLEKGYGRAVGPNDGSDAWGERARGWMRVLSVDAWVSMVVYTGATVAFYLLGAAVLHGKELEVTDETLIPNLSQMYSESFGAVGLWLFLIGAFVVLYSTVFIATASNGRLCADFLTVSGAIARPDARQYDRLVRLTSTALPIVYLLIFFFVGKPLSLVVIGALAQALMLPLLCGAALYFHHARMDRHLVTSWFWTLFLWTASLLMIAFGVYDLVQRAMRSFA
jgi:Mn2+/Fe2+ NRAMP family transporter